MSSLRSCVLAAALCLLHMVTATPLQPLSASSFGNIPTNIRRTSHANKWTIRATNSSGHAVTPALLEKFKLYSEFSAAAYCGPQQQAPGGEVTCGPAGVCPRVEAHVTRIYNTWSELGSTGATGFVAYDQTDNLVVLTLRGSVSLSNWITDLQFFQSPCDQYVPGAKCSSGFMTFWEESKAQAFSGVQRALADYPTANIVVTGHSLGGAAAVYATIELRRQHGNKRVTMYTYGQPRAGDAKLSQYITDQGNNYRITHTDDGVPKLPPEEVPVVSLASGVYKHISPEYWISSGLGNDISTFRVLEGLSNYEGNAGTGQLNLNIIAHIQYFQTNLYYCVLPLPLELLGGAGT